MSDNRELLLAYAKQGSESAFRELVQRYVDLVYSVALRRVNGDTHRAEDVSQIVFTDLARKAASLPESIMLGGWLHRHTCFVASTVMRGELRRLNRELQAAEMNTIAASAEPDWKQLAAVLDEAINALDQPDRDAIILRFFEQRELRLISSALGISEDAAQKRVSRAVDRLRGLLEQRGVTLTSASLAAILTANSTLSAPAGFGEAVATKSLAAVGFGTGTFALLLKSLIGSKVPLFLAATVIVLVSVSWWWKSQHVKPAAALSSNSSAAAKPTPASAIQIATAQPVPQPPKFATAAPSAKAVAASNALHLTLLSADTGKPVPNVQIDYRSFIGTKFSGKKLSASRSGLCDVPIPANLASLELTTRIDGFADTRLSWQVNRGQLIPADYTLRLARPTPIGGRVLDAAGAPVAGAKIGFNHEPELNPGNSPESHEFSWIEVRTDDDGRWTINRMADEMIHRIYGSAKHSEHVDSEFIFVSRNSEAEEELRGQKHVFHLGRPLDISGIVIDSNAQPIARAKVFVGYRSESSRRETVTLEDGTFVVHGCKLGKNLVTAEAKGFAPITVQTEFSTNAPPLRLTLQTGKSLLLRVVNQAGEPIPKAYVWLNNYRGGTIANDKTPPPPQADFSPRTDNAGLVFWESAPDMELAFDVAAPGYMRKDQTRIWPDGKEHVITLGPALIISGTVQNTAGQPIPQFRIITGWPTPRGEPQWSTLDRFRLSFSGGVFSNSFEEAVIHGNEIPGYLFKFEAEGYAPFISRVVQPDEGTIRLNASLEPTAPTLLKVQLADGRPAVGADIALAYSGAFLKLGPGRFSRDANSSSAIYKTDAKGEAHFAPEPAAKRLIIAHPDGYAEMTMAEIKEAPLVQLQPWGRIEGTYTRSGKPAASEAIELQFAKTDYSTYALDYETFRIETDAQGHFVFPKVAPGPYELHHLVPNPKKESIPYMALTIKDIEVHSGETLLVNPGSSGYTVSVRLRWPAGVLRDPKSLISVSIHPPYPAQGEEILAAPPAARLTNYQMGESSGGIWTADDVPPGNYILDVQVSVPPKGGNDQLGEWLMAKLPVNVPAEPSSGTLELGDVALEKKETP